MRRAFQIAAFVLVALAVSAAVARETPAIIIYDDQPTQITSAQQEVEDLWVTIADLKRATRFELKPQGVCRDELCFPIPKRRETEFLNRRNGTTWFNLTAFARQVQQPVAHDEALHTWYFGLRDDQRQGLASLNAPDFTLPDLNGQRHSLSDFRGKKVLLVTWASW